MSAARLDILGMGILAVDDLLYVASYPPADGKAQVLRTARQFGGLIGTGLAPQRNWVRAAVMPAC